MYKTLILYRNGSDNEILELATDVVKVLHNRTVKMGKNI